MTGKLLSAGVIGAILTALLLCGCAGQQARPDATTFDQFPGVTVIEEVNLEKVQQQPKLTGIGPYDTVAVEQFEMTAQMKEDYPGALAEFVHGMVGYLRDKNTFGKIVEAAGDSTSGTIKVEGKILDMRIVSGSARFWGGALAGASYMHIYFKVTDLGTGQVVDEKIVTSSSNPFGAAWTGGTSDRSLPLDMGQIIGEYIFTVVPGQM